AGGVSSRGVAAEGRLGVARAAVYRAALSDGLYRVGVRFAAGDVRPLAARADDASGRLVRHRVSAVGAGDVPARLEGSHDAARGGGFVSFADPVRADVAAAGCQPAAVLPSAQPSALCVSRRAVLR